MQPSEQQPQPVKEEEQKQITEGEEPLEQQAFYEFSPLPHEPLLNQAPLHPSQTQLMPQVEAEPVDVPSLRSPESPLSAQATPSPSAFVYPPPPSFYQNMPVPPTLPPLPPSST